MLCRGEELRPYLEAELGSSVGEPAEFIGKLDDEGRIVAVAGFTNWSGRDVEISLASDGRLRRDFLRRMAGYAFDELGCIRCSTRTPAALPDHWHDALQRMGFVKEGRLRKALDSGDVVIYGMLKEECRFYG